MSEQLPPGSEEDNLPVPAGRPEGDHLPAAPTPPPSSLEPHPASGGEQTAADLRAARHFDGEAPPVQQTQGASGGDLLTREQVNRERHITAGRSFQRPWEEFRHWHAILETVRTAFVKRSQKIEGGAESLREPEAYFQLLNEVVIQGNPQFDVKPMDLQRLSQLLRAYQFGYGPLEDYMLMEGVEDIYFNSHDHGYYVLHGVKHRIPDQVFADTNEMVNFIRRVANENGLEINSKKPNLDATLRDGSRLNATLAPIAYEDPDFVIRKHRDIPFTIEQLVEVGTLTPELVEDLREWVALGLNIVVSGGTSSGKTSLLNTIGNHFIPRDDRVLILEGSKEMQIETEDTKYFQTHEDATHEGAEGEVSMKDLIRFCLRKRPDRIIVGEVRGMEAYHALLAWNSGHDGSMCTVHANNARSALGKLEQLARSAGELDQEAIRSLLAEAVDIVIQVSRARGSAQRQVEEVVQVLHPYKYDRQNQSIVAQVKALSESGQLTQLRGDMYVHELYRRERGRLRRASELIPLAGRG